MTSKEQAEDTINKVVQEFDSTCMGKLPDYRAELYQIINNTIPLAELLEVAKAAIKYEQTNSITARLECGLAIKALRATGKVEL